MNETLSVIIPAYNAEKYLPEALRSISTAVGDKLPQPQIIVVNDGSTDGTSSVALAGNSFLIEKERGGAASARNKGLAVSSGELIAFLDADDIYTLEALEVLCSALCESGADAVFAMMEDFISPELTQEERATLSIRHGPYYGSLPGCSLIRRRLFDLLGAFDETLHSGETVQWLLKMRDSGVKTIQLERITAKRRIHLNNTGRIERAMEMKNYASIIRGRRSHSP